MEPILIIVAAIAVVGVFWLVHWLTEEIDGE